MIFIEEYKEDIKGYIESVACKVLTDKEYNEYQGLWLNDQLRYLSEKGFNLLPLARINGINIY